jgi:hypothetical protein
MPANPKAVVESAPWHMLASKRGQLFLLLAVRIHHDDRRSASCRPCFCISESPLPRSTKIGLCTMMSLTMLSAIVTIIKGTYLPLFTAPEDPRE